MGKAFRTLGLLSRPSGCWLRGLFCALLAIAAALTTSAAPKDNLQFDPFIGFNNEVREGGWFPVVFEIENDGPTFTGTIELSGGDYGSQQTRITTVELPTNTRKRIILPAFGAGRYGMQWSARLLDERRRVRAERTAIPTSVATSESIMLGCLPLAFSGMPAFPELKNSHEIRLVTARIDLDHFPDTPLPLEGLDALYLSSDKAVNFKPAQAEALVNWVRGGGRLIFVVEQLSHVNGAPWLQQFLPMELTGTETRKVQAAFESWLASPLQTVQRPAIKRQTNPARQNRFQTDEHIYRNQPADPAFKDAEMPVVTGTVRDGAAMLSVEGAPLMVQAARGKGWVTLMTFSPEREPFKSWKNRTWFWGRVMEVPSHIFEGGSFNYGGWSVDEVFGALLDSRQVRKLPVGWLLALLVVYLIVIGPLDQYWLRKINRQMLTWITFPAYVALFSLLIYYIGYRLRAGETEWNEMHVVDVLPRGDEADLRGRTFSSIYSSENATYQVEAQQPVAAMRGEIVQMNRGGQSGSGFKATHGGAGYIAQIFVPVWTSLLYVSDWMQPDALPFIARVDHAAQTVTVENLLTRPLTDVRAVVDGRIYDIGTVAPTGTKTLDLKEAGGSALSQWVNEQGGGYFTQVESRRSQFGGGTGGRLENRALTSTVASFIGELNLLYDHRGYTAPAGFDLSAQSRRGDSIFFAFVPGHSFIKPLNSFTPVRLRRDTLLRLVVPGKKAQQ